MSSSDASRLVAPAGRPLELLFARFAVAGLPFPRELIENYGSELALPTPCVYANFVSSVDGLVALPGDTESGQIISGKNPADRFVMGLLRTCADAVLIGAGTFRRSRGHLWHPGRIYPAAASQFAEARRQLGATPEPQLVLLSASGDLDLTEPAARSAWVFTTKRGAARLGHAPSSLRVTVLDDERLHAADVLCALREAGMQRVLTEGGPSLFAEMVREQLVDELFLTSSPLLFGRFEQDLRKSLTDGVDLSGTGLELLSIHRHGSHLFLRYAFERARAGRGHDHGSPTGERPARALGDADPQ